MPDFNSPNFRKTSTQQKPMREFNVGLPDTEEFPAVEDPSQFQHPGQQQISPAEYESRIKAARQEKNEVLKHGARITDHGKRRIEMLADIGRLTRDVKVGETTFSLRTLKARESREATMDTLAVIKYDAEASFESRKQQLIRSIYRIDDVDINEFLGSDDVDSKLELIDSLEEVVVARLWDEFAAMRDEAKTKYGITSNKTIEEVAADLKK